MPNYRLYPEVVFPNFVEDAAQAVFWLINNHVEYSIKIEKIYLMGFSAGAHIASLLAADERYFQNARVDMESISGIIGMAGPYDFLPAETSRWGKIFPDKLQASSQPINFIDGKEIPFLLLHGKEDTGVPPKNSISLAEKIKNKNGRVTLRLYDGINHSNMLATFIPGLTTSSPILQDILSFIKSNHEN